MSQTDCNYFSEFKQWVSRMFRGKQKHERANLFFAMLQLNKTGSVRIYLALPIHSLHKEIQRGSKFESQVFVKCVLTLTVTVAKAGSFG